MSVNLQLNDVMQHYTSMGGAYFLLAFYLKMFAVASHNAFLNSFFIMNQKLIVYLARKWLLIGYLYSLGYSIYLFCEELFHCTGIVYFPIGKFLKIFC